MNQLQLVLMETLLRRLYADPRSQGLVLRGSFVLRHWVAPSPRGCEDLDLLDTQARSNDELLRLFYDLLGAPFTGLSQEIIWANSPWPGLRLQFYSSEDSLQIDIAHGDPLAAEPVWQTMPSLTDLTDAGDYQVLSVRPEIALAWKLHGLFEHLSGNWRPKDLRDIMLLLRLNPEPELLRKALLLAFSSREDPPELLTRLLYGDLGQSSRSQKGWNKFCTELPDDEQRSLPAFLTDMRERLIPLLKMPDDGRFRSNLEALDYRLALLRASDTPVAALKLKSLARKPRFLAYRAYPSEPHLPGSRTGPADRHLPLNKAQLLTQQLYDPNDEVIVQEKLDGSCVGAILLAGQIIALGRDGDLAENSPNPARQLWAEWVETHQQRFRAVLREGERLMGEWLALVHGTRYALRHEPFVAFDLMTEAQNRLGYDAFCKRVGAGGFIVPALLHRGAPLTINQAVEKLGTGRHGSLDGPEGAIWRCERAGRVLLLAKYVRPDKRDGAYLPEITGEPARWNWRPESGR